MLATIQFYHLEKKKKIQFYPYFVFPFIYIYIYIYIISFFLVDSGVVQDFVDPKSYKSILKFYSKRRENSHALASYYIIFFNGLLSILL
jgi:hypothetical protein